jgi:hypothetical protein
LDLGRRGWLLGGFCVGYGWGCGYWRRRGDQGRGLGFWLGRGNWQRGWHGGHSDFFLRRGWRRRCRRGREGHRHRCGGLQRLRGLRWRFLRGGLWRGHRYRLQSGRGICRSLHLGHCRWHLTGSRGWRSRGRRRRDRRSLNGQSNGAGQYRAGDVGRRLLRVTERPDQRGDLAQSPPMHQHHKRQGAQRSQPFLPSRRRPWKG